LRAARKPDRLAERRGEPRAAAPGPTGLAWGSVSEFVAVLPLVERIRARGLTVLMTTGTVTSARWQKSGFSGAFHQFIPLDVPAFITRFSTTGVGSRPFVESDCAQYHLTASDAISR
jgi:3-deoxy-D-manno-octulosonic-acid transferase